MKSGEIVQLLKKRHVKDVCVEQCKSHVTWNRGRLEVPNSGWRAFTLKKRNSFKTGTEERNYWGTCWRKSYKAESPLMDLWVLPRKWKGGEPICYEVKVSRADLFNDHKFPAYWGSCNTFYFVIPNGLLTKDEMMKFAPQVGFMEVNKQGSGLIIKKKPTFMSEMVDPNVYRYVLMWRSEIVSSRFREFNK